MNILQSENRNSFSLWIGIFLPLWCLSLLILFPPQSLDIAISGLFFDGQGWPLKNNFFFNTVLYKSSKIIPVAVALASVYVLAKNLIAYRRGLDLSLALCADRHVGLCFSGLVVKG